MQFRRGDEGIVNIQARYLTRRVGTRSCKKIFKPRIHRHGREGNQHDAFAKLLVDNPIDRAKEHDKEDSFPKKGKQTSHQSGNVTAQSFKKL